LLKISRQT